MSAQWMENLPNDKRVAFDTVVSHLDDSKITHLNWVMETSESYLTFSAYLDWLVSRITDTKQPLLPDATIDVVVTIATALK